MRKDSRYLKGPHHAPAGDPRWFFPCDVAAIEVNSSTRRNMELGQKVEDRGLAGAVRSNQGMNLASADPQAHIVDGNKTLELFEKVPCLEDVVGVHVGK